ncbi:MAG: hypothetical protein M9894_18720 [Planctomycetes bacterium]|nr:hypothetical protein [Planctomycetota bacterium]
MDEPDLTARADALRARLEAGALERRRLEAAAALGDAAAAEALGVAPGQAEDALRRQPPPAHLALLTVEEQVLLMAPAIGDLLAWWRSGPLRPDSTAALEWIERAVGAARAWAEAPDDEGAGEALTAARGAAVASELSFDLADGRPAPPDAERALSHLCWSAACCAGLAADPREPLRDWSDGRRSMTATQAQAEQEGRLLQALDELWQAHRGRAFLEVDASPLALDRASRDDRVATLTLTRLAAAGQATAAALAARLLA